MARVKYQVNLSKKEIELLRDLLEQELFEMSGVVKVSPVKKIKDELTILEKIQTRLQSPALA